eukprot:256974_1
MGNMQKLASCHEMFQNHDRNLRIEELERLLKKQKKMKDELEAFKSVVNDETNIHTLNQKLLDSNKIDELEDSVRMLTKNDDGSTNDANQNLCNIEITESNCDEQDDEKETKDDEIKIRCIHGQQIIHNAEPFNDHDDLQNNHQTQSNTNEVFDEQNNNRANLSLNPYAAEFVQENKVYIDNHTKVNKLPPIYEHMKFAQSKEQITHITFESNPSYKTRIDKTQINDGTIQCKQKITSTFDNSAYQKQYSALKISVEAINKISSRIRENMYHLYNHIIKCMAMQLQQDNEFALKNDIKIKIILFGVHDKTTNEPLYCVAEACNISNYKWRLLERPFTANDIKSEFNIACEQILHADFQPQLKYPEKIKYLMQNEIDMKALINQTKWTKNIPIYNKKSNVKRTTLSLTKQAFIKQFNQHMTCDEYRYGHDQELIPFLMPAAVDQIHEIQFVQVVKLQKTDIFVAFKYEEQSNSIKVIGIHLDPAFILSQHQLLFPGDKCDILDYFRCVYDHLTIGNPDLYENNMKRYKNKYQKVSNFMRD